MTFFNFEGPMQRLMVVGGDPGKFEVEVIDLTGNNQHCMNLKNGTFHLWEK